MYRRAHRLLYNISTEKPYFQPNNLVVNIAAQAAFTIN